MEYVLLLIISISLLLALTAQVFTPLQAFLKSYLGDYVSCLLETGELPSLGSEDARTALQDMGCNARFEPGTFTAGRPPKSTGSGTPPGSAKPSSSSSGSGGSDSSDGKAKSGSSSSSSAAGRTTSQFEKPSRGLESSGGGSGDKVTDIPIAANQESAFMNRQGSWGNSSGANGERKLAVGLAGMTEDEKKKLERKSSSVRSIATGENFEGPKKKISIKKPEPKVVEVEDEPMTFGNFLKFLLIVAIIIVLVVVLGGQALNISKSGE